MLICRNDIVLEQKKMITNFYQNAPLGTNLTITLTATYTQSPRRNDD
jgi:hypothetical protein